jgi:hypothetical protein
MPFYDYRIAAGHGVALVSLTNIEAITPSSDRAFYYPMASPFYNPGDYKFRGDGKLYISGAPSIDWQFSVMTLPQYQYLKTTYCAGGYSGFVTIYTRTGGTAYTRHNATMIVPKEADLQPQWRSASARYEDVKVKFTRLTAL